MASGSNPMMRAAVASMATWSDEARMRLPSRGIIVRGPAPSPMTVPSITANTPGCNSRCMYIRSTRTSCTYSFETRLQYAVFQCGLAGALCELIRPREVELDDQVLLERQHLVVLNQAHQAAVVGDDGLGTGAENGHLTLHDRIILLHARAVDDQQDGGDPARRVDQQRAVVEEQLRRVAAELAAIQQIEVAEDPVQDERQRDRQELRVELGHRLRRHRVERVGGHRGRG